jgi:hypothetical protein
LDVSRKVVKSFRLDPEDVRALQRAKADGVSPSELVRRGLRIVAAPYYTRTRRRPPNVRLVISTDSRLGEEPKLLKEFRD